MKNRIDASDLRAILNDIAVQMKRKEPMLNDLDAAIGDGDHGITMRIGFESVQSMLAAMPEDATVSAVLCECGNVFMNTAGGAIGVILGRMLMSAGKSLTDVHTIGPIELKTMLNGMEAGVVKAGKASPGDKTLLDPLHASCEVLAAAKSDDSVADLLSQVANAAKASAESTAHMNCRFGRASRLGERALGHRDPGAVSFSLIMGAMAEWARVNMR